LVSLQTNARINNSNSIAGEYKTTAEATYTVDGKTVTQTATGILSVLAGNTPGTYYFVEKYPAYEQGYSIEYSNGAFTLASVADVVRYNNTEWYGYQSGSGTSTANKITFTKATDATTGVIRTTGGSDNYVSKPIKKRVTVTATK
jgi:hypothetical protein